jgi:pimeloyl-ACP methyl ester carboxylesterase
VGHDWGAVVGWALAAHHADRLSTWTALSVPHPRAYLSALPRSLQGLRSAYVGLFALPRLPEAVLSATGGALLKLALVASGLGRPQADAYAHAMHNDSLRAALNWYRAARARDLWSVGRIEIPTLYVWGRHDPALGSVAAKSTRSWVRADYKFVPLDAGHWLPEKHADQIAQLLLTHIGKKKNLPREYLS